jgi:hypothetical protein
LCTNDQTFSASFWANSCSHSSTTTSSRPVGSQEKGQDQAEREYDRPKDRNEIGEGTTKERKRRNDFTLGIWVWSWKALTEGRKPLLIGLGGGDKSSYLPESVEEPYGLLLVGLGDEVVEPLLVVCACESRHPLLPVLVIVTQDLSLGWHVVLVRRLVAQPIYHDLI